MKLRLTDTYDCSVDHFWNDLFFTDAYNQALYTEGLGFESVEMLENAADGGGRIRRMRVVPRLDMPGPVKKALGDRISYVEEGHYEAAAGTFTTRIVPNRLADRIRIETTIRVEARGEGRCERVADFDFEVKVFGVGRVFEKFIEKSMRDSYAKAATFTNRWLGARR